MTAFDVDFNSRIIHNAGVEILKSSIRKICQIRIEEIVDQNLSKTSLQDIIRSNLSELLNRRNLDNYLNNLLVSDLDSKPGSCHTSLCECPLLKKYQETLRKSSSYHDQLLNKVIEEGCSCSSNSNSGSKTRKISAASKIHVAKKSAACLGTEKLKMLKDESNEMQKSRTEKEYKSASSTYLLGNIRSTRAQDLRSQSNRDLLKPKTNENKFRTSPYISALSKPKISATVGTPKGGKKSCAKEPQTSLEVAVLARQRTRDVIKPKFFTSKTEPTVHRPKKESEKDEKVVLPPRLKKSQTFVICKGPNIRGYVGKEKTRNTGDGGGGGDEAEENLNDSEVEEPPTPVSRPLTHNDSFCLITKSSRKWSRKAKSYNETWTTFGLTLKEKNKRKGDKGILKTNSFTLNPSIDSSENVESEKIVRFSDEQQKKRKFFRKILRRKRRLQNALTTAWCKRNKLFQKHLQILVRSKATSPQGDNDSSLNLLTPSQWPKCMRDRYEADLMLWPRQARMVRRKRKFSEPTKFR